MTFTWISWGVLLNVDTACILVFVLRLTIISCTKSRGSFLDELIDQRRHIYWQICIDQRRHIYWQICKNLTLWKEPRLEKFAKLNVYFEKSMILICLEVIMYKLDKLDNFFTMLQGVPENMSHTDFLTPICTFISKLCPG